MILGFKQYFPWKGEDGKPEPTFFKEKITEPYRENQPNPIIWTPKIHTFREDPHNRWKAGMKVSMVYRGAGYKILDWFNEGIPELDTIKSIQKIKIKWIDITVTIEGEKKNMQTPCFFIDEKEQDLRNFDKIIINDGFSSMKQFSKWFKKDWSGKILHFTDFRYE